MASFENSGGLDSSNYVQLQDGKDANGNVNGTNNSRLQLPKDPRLLSDEGNCPNCPAENATENSVCCLFCGRCFHATCIKASSTSRKDFLADNPCSKTFFDQFKANVQGKSKSKRPGNFVFVCDPCLTHHEHRNASDIRSHVCSLEKKVEVMESTLTEIKSLLVAKNTDSTAIQSGPNSKATSESPWFNDKRMETVRSPSTRAALVINKDESGISASEIEKIVVDHKIPVEATYDNSAGNKIVVLGSVADRDKLNSKINDAFPDQQTRKPPVRLPTISIANITSEMSAEEIKNTVLAQNTSIERLISSGLTFEVMSVRPQKSNNKFYSTVRVSNHIREHIEQYLGNRLYVGMSRCEVYDHFYVKRCNRCQQFNHYKDHCRGPSPTCAICSLDHETTECNEKNKENFVPSCVNCKKSGCSNGYSHEASSRECYSYIAAQDLLKKSILGSRASKNYTA